MKPPPSPAILRADMARRSPDKKVRGATGAPHAPRRAAASGVAGHQQQDRQPRRHRPPRAPHVSSAAAAGGGEASIRLLSQRVVPEVAKASEGGHRNV
jgi:hypothetical protein